MAAVRLAGEKYILISNSNLARIGRSALCQTKMQTRKGLPPGRTREALFYRLRHPFSTSRQLALLLPYGSQSSISLQMAKAAMAGQQGPGVVAEQRREVSFACSCLCTGLSVLPLVFKCS